MLVVSSASPLVAPYDKGNEQPGNQCAYTGCAQHEPAKTFWERTTDDPVAIFTLALAIVTGGLWVFTAMLWWTTRKAVTDAAATAERQGTATQESIAAAVRSAEAMEKSIAEAARSAEAMERVAEAMNINAAQIVKSVAISSDIAEMQKSQMRAYLTVVVGSAIHQERERNLRFEGNPNLVNTGPTPAKNVSWTISAKILPTPIPDHFIWPEGERVEGITIGPHQTFSFSKVVDDYIEDADVFSVMAGKDKGLYVWGMVTYKDVWGADHWFKYCQMLVWNGDKSVMGYYIKGQNDCD